MGSGTKPTIMEHTVKQTHKHTVTGTGRLAVLRVTLSAQLDRSNDSSRTIYAKVALVLWKSVKRRELQPARASRVGETVWGT
ncbi:hypothetical protein RRG08_047305 [Elysia crispata]|uniref:Uncharacterized protein n=1 Tax=Elysia crispata TaxID=231223 RepID=A0AAE0Z038_9GAST|nr:hypothetical protein RRG08_047305 [Elysia crispata]